MDQLRSNQPKENKTTDDLNFTPGKHTTKEAKKYFHGRQPEKISTKLNNQKHIQDEVEASRSKDDTDIHRPVYTDPNEVAVYQLFPKQFPGSTAKFYEKLDDIIEQEISALKNDNKASRRQQAKKWLIKVIKSEMLDGNTAFKIAVTLLDNRFSEEDNSAIHIILKIAEIYQETLPLVEKIFNTLWNEYERQAAVTVAKHLIKNIRYDFDAKSKLVEKLIKETETRAQGNELLESIVRDEKLSLRKRHTLALKWKTSVKTKRFPEVRASMSAILEEFNQRGEPLHFMGHIFSISDLQTDPMNLEGQHCMKAFQRALSSFNNFLETSEANQLLLKLPTGTKDTTLKLLYTQDPETLRDNFFTRPIILKTGDQTAHAVVFIANEDICIKCNRGWGAKGSRFNKNKDELIGIEIGSFSKDSSNHDLLTKACNGDSKSWDQLITKDTNIAQIWKKAQSIGNCSWTSSKTAILAAIMLSIHINAPTNYPLTNQEECEKVFLTALELYKAWSLWDRVERLVDYNKTPNPNKEMLDKASFKVHRLAEKRYRDQPEKLEAIQKKLSTNGLENHYKTFDAIDRHYKTE